MCGYLHAERSVRSASFALRSFISRYRLITLSRSASIITRCAIESTPALTFPPPTPGELCFDLTPRGNFFSSGGAIAMSFRRRGAALDMTANSLGRWSSWPSYPSCRIVVDVFEILWALEEEEGGLDGGC